MKNQFTGEKVWALHETNLASAIECLKRIPAYGGGTPTFRGLSGWVFEQVVLQCLKRELRAAGRKCELHEQSSHLGGRAKADLQLGQILVEIKLSGSYSLESFQKYARYRTVAQKAGFDYLYLSGEESYAPARRLAINTFGRRNTFFLDPVDQWPLFIDRVISLLDRKASKPGTSRD